METLKAKILTITLDNGLEFAGHELIAKGLGADIYFAHPCASWARGINENTHGLIRQYFPKGTDFNEVSDEHIKQIMDRLNNRPGKMRRGVDRRMNYLSGSSGSARCVIELHLIT